MINETTHVSRRDFLSATATAAAGIAIAPHIISCSGTGLPLPFKRSFGRLNFDVTTLGLGGQASLQWTPPDEDPVEIILKAFKLGINYFDTSNLYGPSQSNYGKAFRLMNLTPGKPGYDEKLRESIFLTSKTRLYWAKGGYRVEGYQPVTDGAMPAHTLYDIKRSLSQIFGDGSGRYPEGAYLNMVLIHALDYTSEVDILYEGLDHTTPDLEHIGALAALRDVRDGTNLTGLNPKGEKLIRHIGFSGHYDSAAMMDMIRRDKHELLDGMLVAINANDKQNKNMQNNVIPVAAARNMGIIAMKIFADGAMYEKPARWSNTSEHVMRHTGTQALPSTPLVRYSLTTPGVHTAIIGTGHVDKDPEKCQLHRNLLSARIEPDGMGEADRKEVENMAMVAKDGRTNYFQISAGGLTACGELRTSQEMRGNDRTVILEWNSALAGDAPIENYQVLRDNETIGEVPHSPQTDSVPFHFEDLPGDSGSHAYRIVTVDTSGGRVESDDILVGNA